MKKQTFTREEVKGLVGDILNSEYEYGITNYAEDNGFLKEQAIFTATEEIMSLVVDKGE